MTVGGVTGCEVLVTTTATETSSVSVPIIPTIDVTTSTNKDASATATSASASANPPLISADLITTEFDALRFDAAAALQIVHPTTIPSSFPRNHNLISSPYNDPTHLLDLRTLDAQNGLLAQALTFMKPIRADYATADYRDSFNWSDILAALRELAGSAGHAWKKQSFYTVIFRSKLNAGVDLDWLHHLDKTSHREATVSGGLLKYWFGSKDGENRNLATCIWRSKEDARLGGLGPDHRKARLAARELYETIRFSTWKLVIEDSALDLRLEEWVEGGSAAAAAHGGRPHH